MKDRETILRMACEAGLRNSNPGAAQEILRFATMLAADAPPVWMPIETAPKDGTEVLVLFGCADVEVVHIAWYRSLNEWESSGQYCGAWDSPEEWEGWWSYTRNSVSQEKLEGFALPTHWHPMLAHR